MQQSTVNAQCAATGESGQERETEGKGVYYESQRERKSSLKDLESTGQSPSNAVLETISKVSHTH